MANEYISTEYGLFSADYIKSALAGICVPDGGIQTGPFGSQLHAEDYVDIGTPIVTVEHIGDNRIIHTDLPLVCDKDKERLSKYTLKTGDIVFSRVGSVDRRAIVHTEENGWLFSGRCLRVRPDPNIIDPGYLSWFLGLSSFKEYIKQIAVGATMPSLNTSILSKVPVYYPCDLKYQQAVATILGALDDKIELNRQINNTLEEMAQSIFKSWFVDFDPVRYKAAGQEPPGLAPHIADLFPDAFEDSELGEIPEGWRIHPLPDVFDINPTRSLPKGALASYLDMANMPTKGPSPESWVMREVGSGMKFINGDTLIARITPCLENGKTAYVDFLSDGEVGWGSTEYIVLRPKGTIPPLFAYLFARNDKFRTFAIQQMTGSSGRQRVPATSLEKYRIASPSIDSVLFKPFDNLVLPMFNQIKATNMQSRILAALRDALLPKLISGELPLLHAERIAGRYA